MRPNIRNAFAVILLLLTVCIPAAAQVESIQGRRAVAREVLVKFRKPGTPPLPELTRKHDLDRVKRIGGVSGWYRLRSRSRRAESMLGELAGRSDIAFAEPNYVVNAIDLPNDDRFPELWALRNTGQSYAYPAGTVGADISATLAWELSAGSRDVVVGIVDTGIDYTHPDLVSNVWSAPSAFTVVVGGVSVTCPAGSHGFNAILKTCDPMDDFFHGTHVAGTIAASGNNGLGVVGVNWVGSLIAAKFLDSTGSGNAADAVDAIEFMVQAKAALSRAANIRVLSNSWGGGGFSQALLDEINRAGASDLLFVAAAGNNGANNDLAPYYPAGYTSAANLLAVAATDNHDQRASFSNYGSASVHLGAPGVNILSTTLGGDYRYASGTSMATPHVAGAAALVLSGCALDTAGVKAALLDNVDLAAALDGMTITGGRLNVNAALRNCAVPLLLTPEALSFGQQDLNTTSAPRYLVLTNRLDHSIAITGVTSSGDFAATSSCTGELPPAGQCQISVAFTPASTGYRTGTVSVMTDVDSTPRISHLAGTGILLPDLVVAAIAAGGVPATGVPFLASDTVANQGQAAAVASTVRFYLSSTTGKNSGVLLSGTRAVPALAAGASSSGTTAVTAPAALVPGAYYLVACADDLGIISEGNETNNCAAVPLQLAGTDLSEAIVSVSGVTATGQTVQVADSVMSAGPGSAIASTTKYYLSSTASKQGAVYLAARSVPALIGPGTSTATVNLALPAWLAPGAYFLLACADETNAVPENNETNNCATAPLQLAGTDLTDAITSIGGAIATGLTVQLSDTVASSGPGSAPATTTKYYIGSTASKLAATYIGLRSVPSLAGASISSANIRVVLPNWLAPGPYWILACADDTNAVAEGNESNNCGSAAVQLGGTDLTDTIAAVGGTVATGRVVQITDTVTSVGPGSAPPTTTKLYLSASGARSGAAYLGSRAAPAITGAATSTGTSSLTLPSWLAPGAYTLMACADETNAVVESNEANNCGGMPVQLLGTDLVETITAAPSAATAGQSILVSDTLASSGPGSAPATTTKFYVSLTGTKVAATYVTQRAAPALVGPTASSATTRITLPAWMAAGSYSLLACADDSGLVAETNETNNCAASPLQVSRP